MEQTLSAYKHNELQLKALKKLFFFSFQTNMVLLMSIHSNLLRNLHVGASKCLPDAQKHKICVHFVSLHIKPLIIDFILCDKI